MTDPVLWNDWHPVASSVGVAPGPLAVRLLCEEVVIWRDANGAPQAFTDRCPHRGTRLSIGQVQDNRLVCRYHGWQFDSSGACVHIPAQPAAPLPANACAKRFAAQDAYGLVWVCLGDADSPLLEFPEHADPALRAVVCGPYTVATSGPRIVENFLDMGHFGFVHDGILGDLDHTEVADYQVQTRAGVGPLATQCMAWQPQTNSLAHGGAMVEYTYRVERPLTAILTKLPDTKDGFREAISLHVQPVAEEESIVWLVLAVTNFEQSEDTLRAFQDRIFRQDVPILENQVPKRLPLLPRAELPIRCDRMSMAYRQYLRDRQCRFGVVVD